MSANTLVAIATPVLLQALPPAYPVNATVIVFQYDKPPDNRSCGHVKLFQLPVNENKTISIIVDFASGQTIRLKIVILLAPSLLALSTISFGMDLKKFRISNILNIPVQPGTINQK